MVFDTKVAILILDDLAVWQKLNVTAFLTTGIAAAPPRLWANPTKMPPAAGTHACSANPCWCSPSSRQILSRLGGSRSKTA
jgi:hypothetical protein